MVTIAATIVAVAIVVAIAFLFVANVVAVRRLPRALAALRVEPIGKAVLYERRNRERARS